jgi:hypothetical protein
MTRATTTEVLKLCSNWRSDPGVFWNIINLEMFRSVKNQIFHNLSSRLGWALKLWNRRMFAATIAEILKLCSIRRSDPGVFWNIINLEIFLNVKNQIFHNQSSRLGWALKLLNRISAATTSEVLKPCSNGSSSPGVFWNIINLEMILNVKNKIFHYLSSRLGWALKLWNRRISASTTTEVLELCSNRSSDPGVFRNIINLEMFLSVKKQIFHNLSCR